CRERGLKLNQSKCTFYSPSISFLGYRIDADGIHKSDAHIKAVRDMPRPETEDELQLFLGKCTFYSRFIPNLSSKNVLLREMLKLNDFRWTDKRTKEWAQLRSELTSENVLMPFNPKLPLILATDASAYGLGAVLAHKVDNGERPIAFISRASSAAQLNC